VKNCAQQEGAPGPIHGEGSAGQWRGKGQFPGFLIVARNPLFLKGHMVDLVQEGTYKIRRKALRSLPHKVQERGGEAPGFFAFQSSLLAGSFYHGGIQEKAEVGFREDGRFSCR